MAATDNDPDKMTQAAPADGVEAVTPHNSNDLAAVSRALWVGGAGDISVRMLDGSSATLAAVPAGTLLPIRVKGVNATGTTATSIVSLT